MSPLEKEIVRRKMAVIAENLSALKTIENMAMEEYVKDVLKRKATERLLQELIEAAVDINTHIIVQTGNTVPDGYYESFIMMAGEKELFQQTLQKSLPHQQDSETDLCMNTTCLITR